MKKYFITGLLIWIPVVITAWVLNLLVSTMDQTLLLLPAQWQTKQLLGVHIPGMGVLLNLPICVRGRFSGPPLLGIFRLCIPMSIPGLPLPVTKSIAFHPHWLAGILPMLLRILCISIFVRIVVGRPGMDCIWVVLPRSVRG